MSPTAIYASIALVSIVVVAIASVVIICLAKDKKARRHAPFKELRQRMSFKAVASRRLSGKHLSPPQGQTPTIVITNSSHNDNNNKPITAADGGVDDRPTTSTNKDHFSKRLPFAMTTMQYWLVCLFSICVILVI